MRDLIDHLKNGLASTVASVTALIVAVSAAHASGLQSTTPVMVGELIAAVVVSTALFCSIFVWIYSANRRQRASHLRRSKFASSALNNMPHGIVMVDSRRRMVFCNDRYLDIYRLSRADIRPLIPFAEVLELRRTRGTFDGDAGEHPQVEDPDNSVQDIGDGRSIKVSRRWLPGGGFVSIHEDFSEQRALSQQLATTKSFLESVIDNIPVCVAVKTIVDGKYVLVNRAFERLCRLPRERIIGRDVFEVFSPANSQTTVEAEKRVLSAASGVDNLETVITFDTEKRLLDIRRVVARDEAGEPKFIVLICEDITDKRALSHEVEATKKFLERVLDHIPVSVFVKDVKDRKYLLLNRRAEQMTGHSKQQVLGRRVDEIDPQAAVAVNRRDDTAISLGGKVLTEEYPVQTVAGLRLNISRRVAVLDDAGKPQYLVQVNEDVTERRETESRMAHMAYHDGLTDLPNRVAFVQVLSQMIEACAGHDEFAVVSIDLDRFKEVNDVFGHLVGDRVLIEASRRIQAAAEGAVVGRLGGDEFALIVDGPQPEAGEALANRLAKSMSTEFVIDGKTIRIGITAGIAVFPRNGDNAATLLANADAALFRAKAEARGSVRVFAAQMDQQIRDRHAMHHELAQAVRNGEFVLNYQPQAKIGGDVIGFEALVRWNHPTRGVVSPGVFIPLIEESGLIVEMGEWILRESCREAASWAKPLQIAVNLSPVQFLKGDLVALVHSILLETGLAPSRLELEITEGVLIRDFERGLALLRRLKALGVGIAMDDFGSGYSSLSYLQVFPFDKIKIDREFVMNIGRNPQSAAIIRAVISLGHGLGIPIVAEGVEAEEQLAFLAGAGCDEMQGYWVGKPGPIRQYAALVGTAAATLAEEVRWAG